LLFFLAFVAELDVTTFLPNGNVVVVGVVVADEFVDAGVDVDVDDDDVNDDGVTSFASPAMLNVDVVAVAERIK
jgi:hypothetical protein